MSRPAPFAAARCLLLIVFLTSTFLTTTPCHAAEPADGEFPELVNTEKSGQPLTPPEEALAGMKLPDGFEITLFASEPDVRQPIALATDDRGRLWVAENYTYDERSTNYSDRMRDRLVILEDTDDDGTFDERTMFWDEGRRLTSVEIGFGGVWVLDAPNLLFIPDRDGDDVPDGDPVVMLDGWNDNAVRHNIVNGLRWGPDGWLYGRHGIMATSNVGRPGASPGQRTPLNCSIWRFHPTEHTFDVVCHGTTNSWGMDWDKNGQLFFINTVIGHLWHAVPGAYFRRMYGEHFNPNVYQVIEQTADHYHWDTSEQWHDIKKTGMTDSTDAAGGGHAHCGMVIVPPGLWGEKYANSVLTINLHGSRLNRDRLVRFGATYVGRHADDFLHASDSWFRGVELHFGPGGVLYLADWSDVGECHENDGVHRTSGRIYRITCTNPDVPADPDGQSVLTDAEAPLHSVFAATRSSDPWVARHALRRLSERVADGVTEDEEKSLAQISRTTLPGVSEMSAAKMSAEPAPEKLKDKRKKKRKQREMKRRQGMMMKSAGQVGVKSLLAANALDLVDEDHLLALLDSPDEHVQSWAVRLLTDNRQFSPEVLATFDRLAAKETSGLVLTYLCSALQEMPHGYRWPLATALGKREEFAGDRVFPLMLWYGIEPAITAYPEKTVKMVAECQLRSVREFIARRAAQELDDNPAAITALISEADLQRSNEAFSLDILRGMETALRGWRQATPPESWNDFAAALSDSDNEELRRLIREVSVVFGDGRALDEIRQIARDGGSSLEERRSAIRALVLARDDTVVDLLQKLLRNRDLARVAINGLAAFGNESTPKLLVSHFGRLRNRAKQVAINTLVSRPEFAAVLLEAVANEKIPRDEVSAFQLRQMQGFGNEAITEHVSELWPELEQLSREKTQRIAELRAMLTPETLADADRSNGRLLFNRSCAKCHTLFGEGKKIAPDLTGGQRDNINYLLENIVDPSATVSKNFKMKIVLLEDGRVFNGVVVGRSDRTITLQTAMDQVPIQREDIAATRDSELSMMPDNLLNVLDEQQIRDLIAYLMSPAQVPLPETAPDTKTAPDTETAAGVETDPAAETETNDTPSKKAD